ncbi:MAG: hypothetical protein CL916_09430 [Deltaproteobacteria bacterium]|nr:hypothetical protein [Deltaproteobacteria bacterium]
MDYRNILALAFWILSVGYTWNSIQTANAFPTGPNVSMGSNPIEQSYKYCNGMTNSSVLSNTASQTLIVTDIVVIGGTIEILIDGNVLMMADSHIALNTGLRIDSGATLSCTDVGGNPRVTVVGYYTHT